MGPASKWTLRLIRLAVALFAVWLGGFLWFMHSLPKTPTAPDQPGEAIAVLTGGQNRVIVGIELLQQGFGKRLLISGVNENITDDHLQRVLGLDAEQTRLFKCCVDTGRQALDTVGNAAGCA